MPQKASAPEKTASFAEPAEEETMEDVGVEMPHTKSLAKDVRKTMSELFMWGNLNVPIQE